MTLIRLAALGFALTVSGAAQAGEVPSTSGDTAVTHAQAWNLTKIQVHDVPSTKRHKVQRRVQDARLRAYLRKRYWGSWNAYRTRFIGFGNLGDGFRTSGKYN